MIDPFLQHVGKCPSALFCFIDVTNKWPVSFFFLAVHKKNTNRYISRICFSVISEKHTGNAEVYLYDISFNNCLNTFESSITNVIWIFSNTQRQTEWKNTVTLFRLKLIYVICRVNSYLTENVVCFH